MISIKQNVEELENLERLCQHTLDCYVDSVADTASYGVEACPPMVAKFKPRFQAIHQSGKRIRIIGREAIEQLDSLQATLKKEMKQYSNEASVHYEQETAAMKDMVSLLAGTAESIERRGGNCMDKVGTVAETLVQLAKVEDLSSIRRALSEQVLKLRLWTEQLKQENAQSVAALQHEVSAIREKLEATERVASTDALTGLSNRYTAEKHMSKCLAQGNGFCLLLFDLDEFKSINDRFGHAAGDQVLCIFGGILREQVRPSDNVSRWGGDEFLVVLTCDLREAMFRSQQIAAKLAGRYPIDVDGREVKVTIRSSAGVAEHRKGDTVEDIFLRVDRSLYASKVKRQRPGP